MINNSFIDQSSYRPCTAHQFTKQKSLELTKNVNLGIFLMFRFAECKYVTRTGTLKRRREGDCKKRYMDCLRSLKSNFSEHVQTKAPLLDFNKLDESPSFKNGTVGVRRFKSAYELIF